MTAPNPSPAEQAVIERFGIFEAERVVEEVARALRDLVPELGARALTWERSLDVARRLVGDPRVVAAASAYRAAQDGGAEEAVTQTELPVAKGSKPTGARRVHGRDISVKRTGKGEESQVQVSGLPVLSQADARWLVNQLASVVVMPPRAALAPQAGDGDPQIDPRSPRGAYL